MNTKAKWSSLLGLFVFSVAGSAQTGQTWNCPSRPAQQLDISTSTASNDYERPVSWKLLVPNIFCDQKNIWLFPLHLTQDRNWIPTVGVAGATAGLIALDPIEGRYFHQTTAYDGFSDAFATSGTELALVAVPTALYVAGWVRNDSKMEHTALLAGQAAADAGIVAVVLKSATSRKRPFSYTSNQNYADSFYDHSGSKVVGGGGFPSGHAILAFSIATVIAHRYRQHRWVPYALYGGAAAIAFSRLTLSQHFTSDAFVGAALGYSISRFAVLQY